MHIVTAKSVNSLVSVSWFLVDRSEADLLFGFSQDPIQRKATRWMSVIALVNVENDPASRLSGASWTSKKDKFNLGKGMGLALARAIETLRKSEREEIWNIVNASEKAGSLLKDTEAQAEWIKAAVSTMHRRANALNPVEQNLLRNEGFVPFPVEAVLSLKK